MSEIDDAGLDLNLLVALDALLAERNVTRAARRLGVTQSTMSHTLSRLREALRDPVLVRAGRAMVPTPRAESLAAPLRRALDELRRVVRHEARFDPATSTRAFSLACPDVVAALLPTLAGRLSAEAPGVRLETHASTGIDLVTALSTSTFDLGLSPAIADGAGLVQRALGEVRFCILARRGHPALARKRFDLDAWIAHPHVIVRAWATGPGTVARAFEATGRTRRIGAVVPGFLAAPFVVAETDFFFAAPRELVAPLAAKLDLVMLEPPLAMPALQVVALWHERMQADAGHTWFRGRVVEAVRAVLGAKPRRRG